MIKYVIVTDKDKGELPEHPERLILTDTDFIAGNADIDLRKTHNIKVINLCSSYDYLSKGYYVSLMAEARGMRCIPTVSDIVTLIWKRNYGPSLPELNALVEKQFNVPAEEPLSRTYNVYFGRTEIKELEPIARRIFDLFRFPSLGVTLAVNNKGNWEIESIEPHALSTLPPQKASVFYEALAKFTGSAWRSPKKKTEKHWLAILHDPQEKLPPSSKATLQKFVKIGKELGIFVELITKNDYASLLEYDALFIRETTAINHHTFRFAHKAEREDIPCIDDTNSIIRCCNKVFLQEILEAKNVPVPKTLVLDKRSLKTPVSGLDFPAVLKIPDGSFSRGVVKVNNREEFEQHARELLKKSEIILCQEFVPSAFDWRIGVLNGQPLFASQYFMAKGHWQIYNHTAKKKSEREGDDKPWPVHKVPKKVMNTALRAAKLIGNGLYGVDLKQTETDEVVVMEVNDNPNIDVGVEDRIEGDELYRTILKHFINLIEY